MLLLLFLLKIADNLSSSKAEPVEWEEKVNTLLCYGIQNTKVMGNATLILF